MQQNNIPQMNDLINQDTYNHLSDVGVSFVVNDDELTSGMNCDETPSNSVIQPVLEKKKKKSKQLVNNKRKKNSSSKKRKVSKESASKEFSVIEKDSRHNSPNIRSESFSRGEFLVDDTDFGQVSESEEDNSDDDIGFYIEDDGDLKPLSNTDALYVVLKHLNLPHWFEGFTTLSVAQRTELNQMLTKMGSSQMGALREGLDTEFPQGASYASIAIRLGTQKRGSVKLYHQFYTFVTANLGKLRFHRGSFFHGNSEVVRLTRYHDQCVAGCFEVRDLDILSRMCRVRFAGDFKPEYYMKYMVYRLNGNIEYVNGRFEFMLYELPTSRNKEIQHSFAIPPKVARIRKLLTKGFAKNRSECTMEGFYSSSGSKNYSQYSEIVEKELREYYDWVFDDDMLKKRYKDIVVVLNTFITNNKTWRSRVQGKIKDANFIRVPEFDYKNAGLSCYNRKIRKTYLGQRSNAKEAVDKKVIYDWSAYTSDQVKVKDFKAIIINWTAKKNVLSEWAIKISASGMLVDVSYEQAHANSIWIWSQGKSVGYEGLYPRLLGQACRIYRGEIEYMIQHVRGWFSLNDKEMSDINHQVSFDVELKEDDDEIVF
jgi:hypothetical protein